MALLPYKKSISFNIMISFKQLTTEELFSWPSPPANTCPYIDGLKLFDSSDVQLVNSSSVLDKSSNKLNTLINQLEVWTEHYISITEDFIQDNILDDSDVVFEVQAIIDEASKYIENNKTYELGSLLDKLYPIQKRWDELSSDYEGFDSDQNAMERVLSNKEQELSFCDVEEEAEVLIDIVKNIENDIDALKKSMEDVKRQFDHEVRSDADSLMDEVSILLEDIRNNNDCLRESTRMLKRIVVEVIKNKNTGYDLIQPRDYLNQFCEPHDLALGILNDTTVNRVSSYLISNNLLEENFRLAKKEDILLYLSQKYRHIYYYETSNDFLNHREIPKVFNKSLKKEHKLDSKNMFKIKL
jgi:hypothetical protein